MNIVLNEITSIDTINTIELIKRAKESTKSPKTIHYLAFSKGEEVAFVSIDRWPELDHLVLYELYVPRALRQKGIGKFVLAEVERCAKKEGFSMVRLRPHPLDPDQKESALVAWYRKCGYLPDPSDSGNLIKKI